MKRLLVNVVIAASLCLPHLALAGGGGGGRSGPRRGGSCCGVGVAKLHDAQIYRGRWRHQWGSGQMSLRFRFDHVDAAAKIQVLNVTKSGPGKPDWRRAVTLPGNVLEKTRGGFYGLRISDVVAKEKGLDIDHLDVVLVRQVRGQGQHADAGPACTVRVNTAPPNGNHCRETAPTVTEQIGAPANEQWQMGNRPGHSPIWYTRDHTLGDLKLDRSKLSACFTRDGAIISTPKGGATTACNVVALALANAPHELVAQHEVDLGGAIKPAQVNATHEPVLVTVSRLRDKGAGKVELVAIPHDQGRVIPLNNGGGSGGGCTIQLGDLTFRPDHDSDCGVALRGFAGAGSAGTLVHLKNLSRGDHVIGGVRSNDEVYARTLDLAVGDAFELRIGDKSMRGIYQGPGKLVPKSGNGGGGHGGAKGGK